VTSKAAVTKPRLIYFDFPGGRGEDCRLALHVAGVDFEDQRVPGAAWAELKPTTPYGALPVLEIEGKGRLAQSNAILRYVGRAHGLHPNDPWQAAMHEALMEAVEDVRATLAPALRIKDEDEKKRVRQELASGPLQRWGAHLETQIGNDGPFVAGQELHVVDLKLRGLVRWFTSGGLDHVPTDVFANFPKLMRVYEAVENDPRVRAWYAR
jgi:glutathione S-transferase